MSDILVAVDGSKHSERVVDMAVELAKATSSSLLFAYVAPKLAVPEEYIKNTDEEEPSTDDYYREFSERIFGNLGARASKKGVKVEKIFGTGNPTEFILDKAKSRKVSMIVLGVEGLHNLGKVRALGSTSRRIIENATVPVVAVP